MAAEASNQVKSDWIVSDKDSRKFFFFSTGLCCFFLAESMVSLACQLTILSMHRFLYPWVFLVYEDLVRMLYAGADSGQRNKIPYQWLCRGVRISTEKKCRFLKILGL